MSRRFAVIIFTVFAFIEAGIICPGRAMASRPLPVEPGQDVVGEPVWSIVGKDDTLLDVARDYDVGYNAIVDANPGVDPWLPEEGQKIMAPTSWVLPAAKREGIVINLAEMRLFYFYVSGGADAVVTYPIGVGREGFNTPLGVFRVTGKEKDPVWYPPETVRKEKPELPAAVPPGPDNPLGGYKISLSAPGEYRIHGTNRPLGVGRRVSHGCIRLYPEDIERLYKKVQPGTRVEIVYQPVKVGISGGRLFVEAHEDYLGRRDLQKNVLDEIKRTGFIKQLDRRLLETALKEKSGVPVDVTMDGGEFPADDGTL
jgi:L,D-transpeptidase ErfK/SrfK